MSVHQREPASSSRPTSVAEGMDRLRGVLAPLGRVLVAYSGGVDSTLVLAVAHSVLGEGALGVTGVSPSLAASERVEAQRLAIDIGARHLEIDTHEHLDPRYQANAGDRCYYCKSHLYNRLRQIKEQEGFSAIADGTNVDDLGDDRPGLRAAGELQVFHPLVVAGLDKVLVRSLSRSLGLPTWDKPEMACLASRMPQGTPVSIERLKRAERAEAGLRALGFKQLRVRDHGSLGRIELDPAEMGRLSAPGLKAQVTEAVCGAGFEDAAIDPEGYRRGGAGERGDNGRE
jgi:uncharacterized protein